MGDWLGVLAIYTFARHSMAGHYSPLSISLFCKSRGKISFLRKGLAMELRKEHVCRYIEKRGLGKLYIHIRSTVGKSCSSLLYF